MSTVNALMQHEGSTKKANTSSSKTTGCPFASCHEGKLSKLQVTVNDSAAVQIVDSEQHHSGGLASILMTPPGLVM